MLFIFLQPSMGLALPLPSVLKSLQMTSNDTFDVICGDLGPPALNFIHQTSRRHVDQNTLTIENYAILNKRNVPPRRIATFEMLQVLGFWGFFVITTHRD